VPVEKPKNRGCSVHCHRDWCRQPSGIRVKQQYPLRKQRISGFTFLRFTVYSDVTKNSEYYNISLAFSKVADPIRLDNILVNPNSREDVAKPTICINGTIVSTYPLGFLQSGDSLQVNLFLPCTDYASGSSLHLWVTGDCFGCGKEVVLP
jgi:hypothetical protein